MSVTIGSYTLVAGNSIECMAWFPDGSFHGYDFLTPDQTSIATQLEYGPFRRWYDVKGTSGNKVRFWFSVDMKCNALPGYPPEPVIFHIKCGSTM